jgi:heavy metal translocating P-type ATPase
MAEAAAAPRRDLLVVEGMFCAACAATLEARLGRLPGIEAAAVDLASGAALLHWAPGRADLPSATRLIASLGYRARRPDEAPAPDARGDPARSLQLRLALALFFGMWTMLPSIGLYLGVAPDAETARALALAAGAFSAPVVLVAGRPFYAMAASTLRAGAPGIDALVALGVLGALVLSGIALARGGSEVYFEVPVALITLQLLARLVDLRLARTGRDALARLLDLAPPRALRLDAQGRGERVPASVLAPGDLVLVDAGETLAVDGRVERGDAQLDRALLTGESRPVPVAAGVAVHAGEVVAEGRLRIRVTARAGDRRVDALARQVRTLLLSRPAWQRGVDLLARHFLALAGLAAFLGAGLALLDGADAGAAAERALAVFVIACPCALSLAAPLAALVATRRAAEAGILLRDLRTLSAGATADVVFVDKTGTLTEGRPTVRAVHAAGIDEPGLLALAARAERFSRHPFAAAVCAAARAAGVEPRGDDGVEGRSLAGRGVRLEAPDGVVRVGSADWFAQAGLALPPLAPTRATRLWVARGERVLGALDLDDALRPGAAEAVAALRAGGATVVILSGDAEGPVVALAERLGIEGVARCAPEDKVARIEAARAAGARVAFVGDGLNDGPALAAADLGIAVDSALDAARTASAVTLVRGGVERLPEVLSLIRSGRSVLRRNLVWAVAYNVLAIPAALLGWVHPAVAAVAMAASSLTIVASSLGVRSRVPAAARVADPGPASLVAGAASRA